MCVTLCGRHFNEIESTQHCAHVEGAYKIDMQHATQQPLSGSANAMHH